MDPPVFSAAARKAQAELLDSVCYPKLDVTVEWRTEDAFPAHDG